MKRALTILVTGPILFSFWLPGPRRVSAQTGGYLVQPYGANLDTWSGLAPSTYFQAGVTDANAAVEDIRKCAGLYNVRKYGAYADGTHDDTAAIQRAINTASAAHSIVYFPAGTYKVTTSLNCPAYTQIVGSSLYHINRTSGVEPYGTTLLFQPTSEATLFTLTGAKTAGYRQDIAFHNFYIRGNTAGPITYSKYAFDLDSLTYATLENVVIEYFQTGIRCYATQNNRLVNLQIANCATSCVRYDAGAVATTDVWTQCVFQLAPIGIQASGTCLSIRLLCCLFQSLDKYGLDLPKEAYSWEVIGCYAEDVPHVADVNNCVFRVGYNGTTLPTGNSLIVTGGHYVGCASGAAGHWLDVNDCNSVNIGGMDVSRYSYAVRGTVVTGQGAIHSSGFAMVGCTGRYTGPDAARSGVWPADNLNANAQVDVKARYLQGSRLYGNDAGTGEVQIVANGFFPCNATGYVNPVDDRGSVLGQSGAAWLSVRAQNYVLDNGTNTGTQQLYDLSGNRTYSWPDAAGFVHVSSSASHDYGGGHADWNLNHEAQDAQFVLTNADNNANMIFPAARVGRIWTLYNNSGHTITVKVSGATGASATNGKWSFWTMSDTDCVKIYEQP